MPVRNLSCRRGFNPEVVQWCIDNDIAITPGCVTPTEIEQALKFGLNTLKFFPANVYGGIDGCKALHGPYRMIKFIPTGGVNLKNLSDFADKPFIHAIGGGWLCSGEDIKAKNFSVITEVVKESIKVLLGFELAHIGINADNAQASSKIALEFGNAFDFNVKQGNSSIFAGSGIEVNKGKGLGDMGHIAIKTNSIERAAYYLESKGYTIDWSTEKSKNGKIIAVYMQSQIGGFAVHLLQK